MSCFVTFVSCVLDDLIDQFFLVVWTLHFTGTHMGWKSWCCSSNHEHMENCVFGVGGGGVFSIYLLLCVSFILYRSPELFLSRSSWPWNTTQCHAIHKKEVGGGWWSVMIQCDPPETEAYWWPWPVAVDPGEAFRSGSPGLWCPEGTADTAPWSCRWANHAHTNFMTNHRRTFNLWI